MPSTGAFTSVCSKLKIAASSSALTTATSVFTPSMFDSNASLKRISSANADLKAASAAKYDWRLLSNSISENGEFLPPLRRPSS